MKTTFFLSFDILSFTKTAFNFGRGFYGFFSVLFTEALASCNKKNWNRASICMSPKSVSQIFKVLFQNRNINIFVLRGIILGDIFN